VDSMSLNLDSQLSAEEFHSEFDYASRPRSRNAATTVCTNPGVLMMILACYQRLLGAFENICSSMHQQLQEMEMTSRMGFTLEQRLALFSPSNRQKPTVSPSSLSVPSPTSQFVMMIKLMSDLLNRLDRALGPFIDDTVGRSVKFDNLPILNGRYNGGTSSNSSSSDSESTTTLEDPNDGGNSMGFESVPKCNDGSGPGKEESCSNSYKLAMNTAEMMHHQQSKLRARLKVLKRLVRSQDV
jgi:hypothetical protein